MNHGSVPRQYLDAIDAARIEEVHLAGHVVNRTDFGPLLIDSHNQPVCDEVWDLYRDLIRRIGPVPTLIEWDTDLPELETLLDHASRAQAILDAHDVVAA